MSHNLLFVTFASVSSSVPKDTLSEVLIGYITWYSLHSSNSVSTITASMVCKNSLNIWSHINSGIQNLFATQTCIHIPLKLCSACVVMTASKTKLTFYIRWNKSVARGCAGGITAPKTKNSPWQVRPSAAIWYPEGHEQANEPCVFSQIPIHTWSPLSTASRHSSISISRRTYMINAHRHERFWYSRMCI